MKKIKIFTLLGLYIILFCGIGNSVQAAQQQEQLRSAIYTALETTDISQSLSFDEKLYLIDIICQQIIRGDQSQIRLNDLVFNAIKAYQQAQSSSVSSQTKTNQQVLSILDQVCNDLIGDNYRQQQKYIINSKSICAVRLTSKDAYTSGYAGYIGLITALTVQEKRSLCRSKQLPYIDTLKKYLKKFKNELSHEKKSQAAPPSIEYLITRGQEQGLRNIYPVIHTPAQNSIQINKVDFDSSYYDYPTDNLGNAIKDMLRDKKAHPMHLLIQDQDNGHYQLVSLVRNVTDKQLIALIFDPRDNKTNAQKAYHTKLCKALEKLTLPSIVKPETNTLQKKWHTQATPAPNPLRGPRQHRQAQQLSNRHSLEGQQITQKIRARITEYFKTNINEPSAIRIDVPDQIGLQCGLHTIVNILAIEALLDNKQIQPFKEQSNMVFRTLSRMTHRKERLSDDQIVKIIQQVTRRSDKKNIYFGSIGVLNTKDNELHIYNDPRLSETLFDQALSELLNHNNQRTTLHVILHTRSIAPDGSNKDHWTAFSIIKTRQMQKPVILVMDSLGNQANAPVRPMVKKAVKLLAYRIGMHMLLN